MTDAFTPPDDRMPVLDSLALCEDEVYKVLFNLDPSKAPGPDGLPTIVLLKTCAREPTPSLCALFNISLAEGKLPTGHKKGKKEDVTNYRPISLLCVVSKVLEQCIFKHFKDFFCPLFDDAQHYILYRIVLHSSLMTQIPVSLKVYKIVSHSKRIWTVCMVRAIIGT